MHSLIYRSVADDSFALPEIYGMLSRAKDHNAERGITGCLLYHNSHFLQLLEGPEAEVEHLYQKISRDERHHAVRLIQKEEHPKALFGKWSMAFYDYGQNGLSAQIKMEKIDGIFMDEAIFDKKNNLVLPFFSNVKDILFNEQ